jgi:rhamnose transport system permease protein
VFSIGDYEFRTMFVMAIVVIVILQLLLGRLRAGRIVYAIGSNPEAALQTGLPVRRTTIAAFTACGALAGLGGFLMLARFGTLTVTAGQGLELESIAAAVVGGVSTLGGSGTIVGSFFGAVLIGLLDQSIVRVPQISEFVRDAVLGLLILLAVVLDGLVARRFVQRRTIMGGGTAGGASVVGTVVSTDARETVRTGGSP